MTACSRSISAVLFACLTCFSCKEDVLKPPPGDPCVRNSDCKDPLSCTFGLCHEACSEARDCADKQTCTKVDGKDINVCQLAVEASCVRNSDCADPLRCAADFQCRAECVEDRDCATKTQLCVDGVCAEPFDTTSADGGEATVLKPRPQPDARNVAGMPDASTPDSEAVSGSSGGARGGSGGRGGSNVSGAGGTTGRGMQLGAVSSCETLRPSNLPAEIEIPDGLSPVPDECLYAPSNDFSTNDQSSAMGSMGPNWLTTSSSCPKTASTQVVQLSDGREAAVLFVESLVLRAGRVFEFSGDRPLIIVSTGRVEINGTITTVADAVTGWFGGGAPTTTGLGRPGTCPSDDGAGGGRPGLTESSLGVGPGGGGFCGKGGDGSTDLMGTARPAGGASYGNPEMVPLVGGSSGGTSGSDNGGHGGGSLQIVSLSEIVIGDAGTISMAGGGGSGQTGGGSGGSILLEAPTVTIRGILAANGGAGGVSSTSGESAKPSDQPARNPLGFGGLGSGGDVIDGQPGNPENTELRLSGGGGGAGRIRINTGCGGKLTVTSSAVISPSRNTPCFSEGQLDE